jgi:hypothetical protein
VAAEQAAKEGSTSVSRRAGTRTTFAAAAVAAAMLIPASQASAGDGPVATKSGAVVNYVTTAKIKLRKRIGPSFVCSVQCSINSTLKLKGPGGHITDVRTATAVAPGVILTHFFKFAKFPKRVRGLIKEHIGKFRLVSKVMATDDATGAQDVISHSFKLKR